MRSPSGGEARHRGGTHIGKAPPSPEMLIFGLTRGRLVGENDVGKQSSSPALPDVRPAPQAGCFVSRLKLSKDSAQIALRHRAFGTVAAAPSSTMPLDTGSFGSRLFEDGKRLVAMFGEVLLALDGTVPPASIDGE